MKNLPATLLLSTVCGALWLSSGCQTTPTPRYKEGVDFKQYRTFALMRVDTEAPLSDPGSPWRQLREVQDGIRETLLRKGFTEAAPANADFLVKVYGRFVLDPLSKSEAETRTGVVEVLDGKTKENVWSNAMSRTDSESLTPQAARAVVVRLLEPFPPGAGK